MALANLHASKDPANLLEHVGDPFGNPASSQFGAIPNATLDVSLATPKKPENARAPAEWGTGSSKGSPQGRRPHIRG